MLDPLILRQRVFDLSLDYLNIKMPYRSATKPRNGISHPYRRPHFQRAFSRSQCPEYLRGPRARKMGVQS
jgi:hypothetical protein